MTGTEFIDMVIEHVGSELTRSKAIVMTNNAQNYILATRNLKLMRVLPDPFLTTAAGVFVYAASTSLFGSAGGVKGSAQYDIRTISSIYGFNNDQRIFAYNSQDVVSERPYEVGNSDVSSEVRAVEEVTMSVKPLAADCSITWWEDQDPGTTTIDWRAVAYRWPTQFLAETIDLEVPDGFQDTLLLYEVLQRAGVKQFGARSQSLDSLILYETARFLKYSGGRISSKNRRTPASEV